MAVQREVKANSHPSFNFADLFLTLPKCPKHCAHTKRGDTEVSGPLYVFLLYFPDCTTSTLSPSAPPHCTGGVRRSRDTFAYLLSLRARVGWHGLPQSITHPACSAASSLWPAALWEGKNIPVSVIWDRTGNSIVLAMMSPVLLIGFHSLM